MDTETRDEIRRLDTRFYDLLNIVDDLAGEVDALAGAVSDIDNTHVTASVSAAMYNIQDQLNQLRGN